VINWGSNSDEAVVIAGWKVKNDSLTKGKLGDVNSIILSTAGIDNSNNFGNNKSDDKWMLGIGSNFGVTTNGEIYATAGKIGGLNIGTNTLSNLYNTANAANTTANKAVPKISDTNNFSWNFDAQRGLYMYNGLAANNHEVFKIFKETENGPYIAWLKGHV
jgi:hypothetical protein